ncbi:MAG: hypothetical protein ACREUY_05120, partial [Burkholderiales bacterium]
MLRQQSAGRGFLVRLVRALVALGLHGWRCPEFDNELADHEAEDHDHYDPQRHGMDRVREITDI